MDPEQPLDYENLESVLNSDETPTRKQMLEMLDSANIPDEMKEQLRASLGGSMPELFGKSAGGGTMLAVLFVLLIFSVIFFFGYKLYKSITDKQVKQEEKKKAKQLKKKK